jgi:hypothetical protein
MNKFLIALSIGILAGIIDVVPMIFQKLNKYACISAFMQWVFLGFLIPFVNWNMQPWLKGLIIAELAAIPVMVIISEKEIKSIIPIALFSAVLGVIVGIAGAKFIQ